MVEIDNLITSRAHDKNYEKYKNSEWTSQENEDLELVWPVWMSIDQSNSYRKEFSWLHFDDESRVQGDQWRKDQQSYRTVSVAHLRLQHGYDNSILCKVIW